MHEKYTMQFLGLFYALIIHRRIIPEQNTAADTYISRLAAVFAFSYQSSDTSDLNINVASFSRPRFKTSESAAGLLMFLVLELLSSSCRRRSNAAASRT